MPIRKAVGVIRGEPRIACIGVVGAGIEALAFNDGFLHPEPVRPPVIRECCGPSDIYIRTSICSRMIL